MNCVFYNNYAWPLFLNEKLKTQECYWIYVCTHEKRKSLIGSYNELIKEFGFLYVMEY